MTNLLDLEKATFVALETYKKSGEGKITPTWVTGENGKLYIWTDLESWKVKRIRNNPQVRICQSDYAGNPKGEWFEARAKVLVSEEAREKARQLFLAKYRLQFRFFYAMGKKSPKAILEIDGR